MSEEILHNEDKETLRRRLEHLKQEYERTAQRLQRAEHHDAIRRHRLTQIESSQMSEPCSATSSTSTSDHFENHQNLQLQTNRNISGFSAAEKIPAIQLQLAEITSTPPLYSPACKRSPAHRLRSKRSRLRLQNKERESDTDLSQENIHERENAEIRECPNIKENSLKKVKNEEKDFEKIIKRDTEKEKSNDKPIRVKTNSKNEKPPQDLENDGKKEEHCVLNCSVSQTNDKLSVVSSVENQNTDSSKVEVDLPLTDRPVKEELHSSSPGSTHTSFFSQSAQATDNSGEMLKQTKQSSTKKDYDDKMDVKHSSFTSGVLDSCTLVEGLPFPVEYYVRTTRRMAASNSSIDLDAVIYSQLTGGRGRRRLSQSQVSSRGQVTPERSEPVCRSTDQPRGRGRGRRGRRGRRRTSVGRTSSANFTAYSTESFNKSQLVLEGPQVESHSNDLHGTAVNLNPSPEHGATQDLKHLPDSQLYIDSQLLPDSNLYPIFRRKLGQTGLESQTATNKNDQSPFLPSLATLIQTLQEKETKTGQITPDGIQDFHLPDEDFGQLKLARLRLPTSIVEPFPQHPLVYKTRQSNRRQRVRKCNTEAHCSVGEIFTPEPIITSSFEDSLPLCQSDPIDQSQTEIQKDLHAVIEISSALMNGTESDECINNEKKVEVPLESSETEHIKGQQSQIQKQSDILSEKTSLSPVILKLSPSLTTHTQKSQDPVLPSLGMSPHFLTPGSPLDLRTPLFSSSGILKSPSSVTFIGCLSPDSVSANISENMKNSNFIKRGGRAEVRRGSRIQTPSKISQESITKAQNNVQLDMSSQSNIALGYEHLKSSETPKSETSCISGNELEHESSFDKESNLECGNKTNCTTENEAQLYNNHQLESFNTDQNCESSELWCQTQSNATINAKPFHCENESGSVSQTPFDKTSLDTSANQRTERSNQSEEFSSNNLTLFHEQAPFSDAGHFSTVLEQMHTFKALEDGCVLDLCLVRWPSEDCCICVAGQWSVCLWAQRKGDQTWSLLHSWTFAQSVMSLQAIADSSGLLCVTLGHLEIAEARVLCCPGNDGPFSQTVVCTDTLQAVVGVSNCRLVCCSTPGYQQRVSMLTLSQEGSVVKTLPFISAKQNIQTLAAVEGEKKALVGWTECKTLLIWSMKSGQLLQAVCLEKTLTMTNCMKGYSYRGVLCVLLQNSGKVCDEEINTCLFTLIATNPLTGKHITLSSINHPDQPKQQLIDSDVSGSRLVGVFQNGHLAVWDLRESVAKAAVVLDESCRLARWAGPDTLLTGYLNGDVSVFRYKST
ncbi:partner and localizer of BRCA2 [Danio aesculapii]|uniref:partner and localizer of BRCA2 n=1 Tax=Danio aesculapii TaxID=1142201 RepID=UPI0024C0664D|nr:partner and localizer of BRCA2 [Danio aesculapii]